MRGEGEHDDVVTASCLQHVCDEFCGDWSPGFIFLVLSGIGETRYNCGDPSRGRCSACVDHDEKFH